MHDEQSIIEQRADGVCRTLRERGYIAYWAGGCVRDRLLGRPFKDIDIATNALPDTVMALFERTVPVGKAFGVVRVFREDTEFEVATFRKDLAYRDGRRPEGVTFCSPEEDAQRRDFTINGMFYDSKNGRVLDFVGGQADLGARMVRAIGDPLERFREDRLRLLRAVRFAHALDFEIEPRTAEALRGEAPHLTDVSMERIRDEFSRILTEAAHPGDALRALEESGLLKTFLPEISAMRGVEQPPQFHPEGDVFEHTVLMLNAAESPSLELALAVLFHDVGKPPTQQHPDPAAEEDRIRFPNHALAGHGMTRRIMARLRYPNRLIERVSHCVRNHMRFIDVPNMKSSTLRRLAGAETFDVELELHRLDCACSHGDTAIYDALVDFREALQQEPVLPEPLVRGRDLIKQGFEPGPAFGPLLKRLYDIQLEHPESAREDLLAAARNMNPPCPGSEQHEPDQ